MSESTPRTDDSPEAIREDIELTKQQIRSDLDALEARVGGVFSLTSARAGMRENPAPWLLAGGAALLILAYALRPWRRRSA